MRTRPIAAPLLLVLLAGACGVDGPPTPPPPREDPPAPGVTIRGEAGAGVVGGS